MVLKQETPQVDRIKEDVASLRLTFRFFCVCAYVENREIPDVAKMPMTVEEENDIRPQSAMSQAGCRNIPNRVASSRPRAIATSTKRKWTRLTVPK